MTQDAEHFKKYLSAICVSSLENSVQLLALFVLLIFSFVSSSYILDTWGSGQETLTEEILAIDGFWEGENQCHLRMRLDRLSRQNG